MFLVFYILLFAFQAVTSLLNNESTSDIDRMRLVMLYALRYEKESPVQLMQLFNKLASCSAKYKKGVLYTFIHLSTSFNTFLLFFFLLLPLPLADIVLFGLSFSGFPSRL